MTENEQLDQLIQAAEQMANDDPRLTQIRGLIRLRVLAKPRETYPNLDLTDCADVMAMVFKVPWKASGSGRATRASASPMTAQRSATRCCASCGWFY